LFGSQRCGPQLQEAPRLASNAKDFEEVTSLINKLEYIAIPVLPIPTVIAGLDPVPVYDEIEGLTYGGVICPRQK